MTTVTTTVSAQHVAGYTYAAAIYCPACLPITRPHVSTEDRPAYAVAESVERVLDNLAAPTGAHGSRLRSTYGETFDRHDEYTFDSDDFPKVLHLDGLLDRSEVQCHECGLMLDPEAEEQRQDREALSAEGYDLDAFAAWAEDRGTAIAYDDRHDFDDAYAGEWSTFREYADQLAEELLDAEGIGPDSLARRHFDYDGCARDLILGGEFWTSTTADGTGVYIFRSW